MTWYENKMSFKINNSISRWVWPGMPVMSELRKLKEEVATPGQSGQHDYKVS